MDIQALLGGRSKALIGLDISSSSVKLVELAEAGTNQFRLERYAIEPLPRDAVTDGNIASLEAVAESIRRAWKRLGSSTKQVAIALPAAAVITKKITLPAGLRELEMEIQVESEANQYIPFAIEEVNLDYQVLGPAATGADEVEVLIAASRKEKVEDRVAAVEAAGLKAIVMDVESFASQAAFDLIKSRLPEAGKGKVVAMVDIGAQMMKVTILRDENVLYSREQAFGGNQLTQDISRSYGMSTEEAEAAKRSSSLPENYEHDLLKPFTESVALEISRALQFFFTSTQFNQVDHIILSGGCAVIQGIDQVVASRTQVATEVANPFVGMSLSQRVRPKNLAAEAPALLVACGLAMRRFDA
jgi:type IV pilus assembly protein PilM